eukprot:TRINITY_DN14500_c0_g1_i1.p1 TRINITY_DN14500_c0_g1~~TRINITY_DN14500_c0_g1_i1.p1  ORF type:complete len:394 (+),score=13.56 TRINITY_DN14500_c0_g1_i1:213-1394(+)
MSHAFQNSVLGKSVSDDDISSPLSQCQVCSVDSTKSGLNIGKYSTTDEISAEYSSSSEDDEEAATDKQPKKSAVVEDKNRKLGAVAVVVAIAIFSANAAVYKRLFSGDPETFSVCNVICGSNFVGLFTLLPVVRKDVTRAKITRLARVDWLALVVGTLCYSVFGPFFYLKGLEQVSVPTAAIIQQVESPLFLLLAVALMDEAFDWWSAMNVGVLLLGTGLSIMSAPMFGESIKFGTGQLMILISSLFTVASLLITRGRLAGVPTGILLTFRFGAGTFFYYSYERVLSLVSGREMLTEAYFSSRYWQNMWWYSILYVTLGQGMWIYALGNASATAISLGTASRFVVTVIFGIIILSDYPTGSELLGSTFIMISVNSGLLRSHFRRRQKTVRRSY